MQDLFARTERVLAAVAALALFALNDVRMFHMLPRAPEPGAGKTHALSLQLFGAAEQVYAAMPDLVIRWGLVGLTIALCCWAIEETLRPSTPAAE
jgi:hypothetical protein